MQSYDANERFKVGPIAADAQYALGSAPPSPPPTSIAAPGTHPPPPPPSLSSPYALPHQAQVVSPPLPPLPPPPLHGYSPNPESTPLASSSTAPYSLASSLQQLSGEAAFLPTPRATEYQLQQSLPIASTSNAPDLATASTSPDEDYIPGLMSPHLFVVLPNAHPILFDFCPQTDNLTPLVERYLGPSAPRDLSGADGKGKTVQELIVSRHVKPCIPNSGADVNIASTLQQTARKWRGLAELCHDVIMSSSPEATSFLLGHWLLRLHCLLRLHLVEHFATELLGLIAILPPLVSLTPPPARPTGITPPRFIPVIPFELHVMLATLPALRGDPERSVGNLSVLLKNIRCEMWVCEWRDEHDIAQEWKTRAERIAGMIAAALVEIKAYPSATYVLTAGSRTKPLSSALLPALTRLQLATGDIVGLSMTVAASNTPSKHDRTTRKMLALGKVARGDWADAEADWRALVQEDDRDAEALNNLAVVLLFASRLNETRLNNLRPPDNLAQAINLLAGLFSTKPSTAYASETIIFNYAILLELRTDKSMGAKVELLRGVLSGPGAEDVRSTYLKLEA
ncbi:BQ5605_C013g07086 [Microbotryum silenes-dioicae]|uniref:BQ5605_C013g07086 protein n=1 Tax=Microbotryum silenes-dioicae TaxID=796604 RepID=A0A2X0MK83_9BASI|nr:BQ5605_C013g07086 [Microbotryum silenes-dioicae]